MAFTAPPSSQKAGDRPISFLLDRQSGAPAFVDMVIRPEDLTRTDPSRINVQQTLGGAWADDFGPGIAQITLSGHTGWRRPTGGGDDGLERFLKLKDAVFDQWHVERNTNIKAGIDPSFSPLIFSDALDNFAAVVAPMSFTLRRSRSRPLLAQYQISLMVLDEADFLLPPQSSPNSTAGPGAPSALADALNSLGLSSMSASVDRITGMINSIHAFIDASLVGPVQGFMGQTAKLYGSVRGAISAGISTVGSLISVAQMTAQAGVNLFRTLSAVASIPQLAKQSLMALSSAYSNIACVLHNALNQKLYVQDYSDLYGASNCSSTSGGRPISTIGGTNPFYNMVPTGGPAYFSMSQPAHSALAAVASSDPALAPMSTAAIGSAMSTVSSGLAVA